MSDREWKIEIAKELDSDGRYLITVDGKGIGYLIYENWEHCDGRSKGEIITARAVDLDGNDADWFPCLWYHTNQDHLAGTVEPNLKNGVKNHLELQAEKAMSA